MIMRGFTDLEAWKKAHALRKDISVLVKNFPVDEKYRLTDQIIRSSRSVGNNIAEGHGRFHYIDSRKFFINARGSASETIDHLIIALDEGYITKEIFEKLQANCDECMRLINGYINYLKQQSTL
ncbi:MAG: four helix bundle protein [Bacteroidetes bacterium]|nr:four helix bundle protein [Bacteroidota bacterium]